MRSAQVQAFKQDGFVQFNALEVGIDGLACSFFKARWGFDLGFYSRDGADVGLPVLRQLGCRLGSAIKVVDDDVGVEQGDHAYLLWPLVAHGALQYQSVALRGHAATLRPQAKTCALRHCGTRQHLIYGTAHSLRTTYFFSLDPCIQAAGLRCFKINDDSQDK